jgi:hypothetical protein
MEDLTMSNEKIIARIKALRALATSSNVHEAAAAAAQAARLLLEHDLAEADVQTSEPVEAPTQDAVPLDVYGSKVARWRSALATFLIKQHGCYGWVRHTADGKWAQVIVGRRGDVETVRYMYAWLTTEITRIAQATGRGNGRSWFNSFYWGAVSGIREQMMKTTAEVRSHATGTALAVVDARLVASRALAPPGLRSFGKVAPLRDGDGYRRGQEAGRSMHVGKAIGSGGGAAKALGSGR